MSTPNHTKIKLLEAIVKNESGEAIECIKKSLYETVLKKIDKLQKKTSKKLVK